MDNNNSALDLILNHPTGIDGVNYNQFVLGLFRPMEQAAMFTHAALGVVSEYHEATLATDPTNYVEELGDYLFFMVAMLQQLPESAKSAATRYTHQEASKLVIAACREMPLEAADLTVAELAQYLLTPILDVAKRWLAYDKAPTDEQAADVAVRALTALPMIRSKAGDITDWGTLHDMLGDVIKANVAKLRHRYKSGFSTEAAIHRDIEGEARVLRCA